MKEIALGIDIGGTNTVFGLIDREGICIAEGTLPTQKHADVEDYIDELFQAINTEKENLPYDVDIKGIGIGAPNASYYTGTIEDAANLRWKKSIPLAKLVKKRLDVPVYITNDANAAAMGEKVFGAARDMNNFMVITLGTGLGSGIFANGDVLHGHDGFAGEVGHMIVRKSGRECGCGRKGCLETYVSATGVKRSVYKLLARHSGDSELRDIPFNKLTAKMVAEAANRGDEVAKETFTYTATILGEVLANVVAVTSPEAIFLFGGLTKAGNILFDPVRETLEKNLLSIYKNKIRVLPSGLKDNAAVLGSAALVWNKMK
ncbi:ROK family protein [Ancylomarina euxinus]|uniref:ROK family protein n=1 Tax=Ancylomarina euxinus TaxID=2283627 RepID=A0A425Y576_9BACT|nr:ROK family protein [Ancylomarina euxinus]MCZ4694329.1 ROK family protein [Ancylomarina euxinus]MUP14340.1 ROK family protein [Ancylomarina euxinus]RRG23653.1 ROK family protein [Ancylomarina euxinus]